jgi:protein LSM14
VEKAIPPSDQVYPCIIFNAADIKDLTVCQAPAAQPPLQDPAIMGYPAQPGANPYGHYNPYDANPYGGPPPGYGYNPYAGYNPYGQTQYPPGYAPQQPGAPPQPQQPAPSQQAPAAAPQPQQQQPPKSAGASASAASKAIATEKKASGAAVTAAASASSKNQPQQQRGGAKPSAVPKAVSQPQHTKPQLPTPKPVPTHQPTAKKAPAAFTGGKLSAADIVQRGMAARGELKLSTGNSTHHASSASSAAGAPSQQRSGQRPAQRPVQRRSGPSAVAQSSKSSSVPPAQPVGEFDFAKSNALFNKEEFFKTAVQTDGAEEDVPPSYQKDDFFDSISCEALDRQRQQETGEYSRPSNHELNARDIAAFGTTASGHRGGGGGYRRNYNRSNQHRRGGGRSSYHRVGLVVCGPVILFCLLFCYVCSSHTVFWSCCYSVGGSVFPGVARVY